MRIKLYNQFLLENSNYDDKIVSDINDIFVELKDDGFDIDINTKNYRNGVGTVYIYIENDNTFRVDDVQQYVMMLNDYMDIKLKGFKIKYCLDYMHSNSSELKREDYYYFPTGCTYDINNLLVQYNFDVNESLVIEGFGDFVGPEYDKIESDVNDMFIDLKDDGAKISIDFYHKGVGYGAGADDYMIKVRIYSDRKFSMSDVEEPTRMMVDYFKDLTDKRVDMEYQRASDYTNTRQSKFNPYSFDNEVTIYLIERA